MNSRAMVALEAFNYPFGSRDLAPGDAFEALSDGDAHALRLTRKARDAALEDPETSKASTCEKSGGQGKYKRRDMAAG